MTWLLQGDSDTDIVSGGGTLWLPGPGEAHYGSQGQGRHTMAPRARGGHNYLITGGKLVLLQIRWIN